MAAIDGVFAPQDVKLPIEIFHSPAQVLDLRRDRRLANRHAGRGRVEQADRLVGQLAAGDVAVRQPHGIANRLVEHAQVVMLFQRRRKAAHHVHRLLFARLFDLDDLESPGQRGVLLEVLLVFRPGRGGDRPQLAAGQRRLEQIGRIALARPSRQRRSACGLRR